LKSPENIQKLVQLLSQSPTEDYNTILKDFDFESINFSLYESWSNEGYTRNCLFRDADFELIVICWEQGQGTAVHGHDGEDCWVYLLEGEIHEVYFNINDDNNLQEVGSHKVIPNQLTFMNDKVGFHKLENCCEGRSMSLHLYAKPIENCVSFDETTHSFVTKELSYDTYKEFALKD
jgi:hypothetical protein